MTDRRVDFPEPIIAKVAVLMEVATPLTDLCRAARGDRDAQLLMGAQFEVRETWDGWCFGRSSKDRYIGYVDAASLTPVVPKTHWVCAQSTHIYTAPYLKSQESAALSFGAQVTVSNDDGAFFALASGGFIPAQHVAQIGAHATDLGATALKFLGTPYLWGANSRFGVDCSGLVQLCCEAHGWPCPRDSDQQEAFFSAEVARDEVLRRGDLVFWRGHVGMMLNEKELVHANAHHMAVEIEPLSEAIERISQREFGEITSIKRPSFSILQRG
jgi:cell wall-associated NlpC family hydrolase